MYHEVWRIERSYFYDANLHGVNAADGEKEYEKYLDTLGSRNDLNYIIHAMLSEFTVGHLRGGGGTVPEVKTVPGGLLGADYEIANDRYRFKKIYTGESWNPQVARAADGAGAECFRRRLSPGRQWNGVDGQG
jgi:tricorn protease